MRCAYCDIAYALPRPTCRGCGAPKCAGADRRGRESRASDAPDAPLDVIWEYRWLGAAGVAGFITIWVAWATLGGLGFMLALIALCTLYYHFAEE